MLRLERSWPRTDRTGWLSVNQSQEWRRSWVVLKVGRPAERLQDAHTLDWSARV